MASATVQSAEPGRSSRPAGSNRAASKHHSQHLVNRAEQSKSPYVRSHRNNPVAWQLWDVEAISFAKKHNRLIFLSIGYSACHWCHVMARESFASEEIASLLNRYFVPIKVDREERPDIDDVYMNYVEATNGSGGWPLNVFLTPELEPVFGGTYWPSGNDSTKMTAMSPGGDEVPVITFVEILRKMKEVWETQQGRCRESARGITQQLKEFAEEGTHSTPLKDDTKGEVLDATEVTANDLELDVLEEAYSNFAARFDTKHKGFGLEPKFPMPANLSFLLRLARYPASSPVRDIVGHAECQNATDMVVQTLLAMARGALHDHLGHGFARYSITADWGLPHFEKVLSDQAQLLDVYLDAYESTGDAELLEVIMDLTAYLTKAPIQSQETGAWYCSEDADSLPNRPDSSSSRHLDQDDPVNQKYEGAYYTWSLREFTTLLGSRDAEICARYWGVEADGNIPREYDPADEFLNQNVLRVQCSPSQLAREFGLSEEDVLKTIKASRRVLNDYRRTHRVPPDVDDKVVAGWNGLAIHALAKASVVLSKIDPTRSQLCLEAAERCFRFIKREMVDSKSGQIWRVWRRQARAETPGFADDYAYLCQAAISMYYATFADDYLQFAELLQSYLNRYFLSYEDPLNHEKSTGFYMTPDPFPSDVAPPLLRLKQGTDSAHPAANAVIVQNLLRLSSLLNDAKYRKIAEQTVAAFAAEILQHPFLYVGLLDGVVGLEVPTKSVVGVVTDQAADTKAHSSATKVSSPGIVSTVCDQSETRSATLQLSALSKSALVEAAREVAGTAITTITATIAVLDRSQPRKSQWLRERNSLLRDLFTTETGDASAPAQHRLLLAKLHLA